MDISEKMLSAALEGFQELKHAVIDASSIIYLTKAGCFFRLSQALMLWSLPEILTEVGFSVEKIRIAESQSPARANDDKLLSLAISKQFSIISEDKKLLSDAQRVGLPFYNSLMVLNFLFFKNEIGAAAYFEYLNRLKQIARYQSSVWEFGAKVFDLICLNRLR